MCPTYNVAKRFIVLALLLAFCSSFSSGYSVLTHEEIVDLLWKDQIQPLLLKRFPATDAEGLRQAHAYAYGGSLIQDMGYYPFGNKYFSDLLHYVRTGDFVKALIQESSDVNEYAFSLGALAHYASDNVGHPTINRAVALDFPKLRRKYGDQVTYADDPKTHIRTEFGFDMVQVAKNRYTSDRYHDFIGFSISKPLLERAFQKTYSLQLQDVIHNEDLAIGTFRRAVSKVIPEMTRVALLSRRKEIVRDTPNFNEKEFLYHLSRTSYQKEWGKGYRTPGAGARFLSFLLKVVPKVGPFRAVAFKIPTTQTEDMYIKSIDQTVDHYGVLLTDVKDGELQLTNLDCDTGRGTSLGEYPLADKTYARLLDDLAKHDFAEVSLRLRANLLAFYAGADPSAGPAKRDNDRSKIDKDKTKDKAWQTTEQELQKLRATSATIPSN